MRKALIKRVPLPAPGTSPSRWAVLEQFDIPDRADESQVYLRRTRVVSTPWWGIYLHRIFLADGDRHPHDHPWPFASLILRGSYVEQVWSCPTRTLGPFPADQTRSFEDRWPRRRGSLHRVSTDVAHKIVEVTPDLLTLVFVGRKVRTWGFWTEAGFIDWKAYDKAGLGPDPFDS